MLPRIRCTRQVCTQAWGKTASLDRLGEPLEPVDVADQHVIDAALLELAQHREPELGALRGLEPEPDHVTVEFDPDGQVADAVSDRAAVADLYDQAVEEEDRVDVLQRP
jgi:hypothetical protein